MNSIYFSFSELTKYRNKVAREVMTKTRKTQTFKWGTC